MQGYTLQDAQRERSLDAQPIQKRIAAAGTWFGLHLLLRILLDNHAVETSLEIVNGLFLWGLVLVGIGGAFVLLRPDLTATFRTDTAPRWLGRIRSFKLFPYLMFVLSAAVLTAIWTLPVPFPMQPLQRELMRGYGTVCTLGITYTLMFWRGVEQRVSFRQWAVFGGIVSFAVLVIAVAYLDKFPQLNQIDELHNWHEQWTFARTGLLGEAMYRQMIPLPQPILDSPHYVMGFLLRFIGDTFWQSRFARLLLACLALPFIYLAGAKMYDRRTGVFAVVFAAFLIPPTGFVRPDVFVGVMISVAIYVYWRAQTTRRPLMHYLTGLCVALAGEGHPLAYRFGLAFAAIYGVRWLYEMWQQKRIFIDGRVFALGMGGITGMIIYLGIHILPNTEQGLHFYTSYGPGKRPLTNQLAAALDIVQSQVMVWASYSPFEFIFFVLGLALAVHQNKQADRLLLVMLLVSEGLLLLTYGYYRQFYQAHFLPIFALLGGRFIASITEWGSKRAPVGRFATAFLAAIIFIAGLAVMVQDARAASIDRERDEFTAIAHSLKADIPPTAVVVGNENYMLEMRSMNYYGIQTVTTPGWYLVNYAGYKLWEVTKPDIFILSGNMDTPKYTDMRSIVEYMNDNGFKHARCYTKTGLIEANVYVKVLPPGWSWDDMRCAGQSVYYHP